MYVPGDHSYDKRRGVSIAPCLPLGIRCYYCQFPTRTNTQNEKKKGRTMGEKIGALLELTNTYENPSMLNFRRNLSASTETDSDKTMR